MRSQTAFEETVDRLGHGDQARAARARDAAAARARALLAARHRALDAAPGADRADRERPPVRRARARRRHVRRRPAAAGDRPSPELLASWREACDARLAVEFAVAGLAAERATPQALAPLGELVEQLDDLLEDFEAYRQADVRLHIGARRGDRQRAARRRDDRRRRAR